MDSIDRINNMTSYPITGSVKGSSNIGNLINQLNKDTPNAFNNQLANKSTDLLTGEIIDLKSNEIMVRLNNGSNVSAQIYDTSNLSIGQTIKFRLQENKGVLILEPVKTSDSNTSNNLLTKALIAANLPVTDRNTALVNELIKHNMPLDSKSINSLVSQANINKDINIETLVLMNKNDIPITDEYATEIGKYKNYEHRLIKEIDNISTSIPKLISTYSNEHDYKELLSFNTKLVDILTNNKASSSINMSQANLTRPTNQGEFNPLSNLAKTNMAGNNSLNNSNTFNTNVSNNVPLGLANDNITNTTTQNAVNTTSNATDITNNMVNNSSGSIDNNANNAINNGSNNINNTTNNVVNNSISTNNILNNFTQNNLPGITDIPHTSPILNDKTNRLTSPDMISGDATNNIKKIGNVYNANPDVASAYLRPSSAKELHTILEPYNVDKDIMQGIKDGTAPLREVADAIHKAMEYADELDEYRVSDYKLEQMGGPSSVEYGTVSPRISKEMGFIDSYANPNSSDITTPGSSNTPLASSNYVNIPLAKDAFEHPVIKNILDKYDILQRDNSEVASFQNFYNRGQLTSKLRDIPNTEDIADRIWKGNISANELLLKINEVIQDGDPKVVTKLLNSDQYSAIIKEAIINNWTISPNALKQKDIVKDTYDNMYDQITDLQNFVNKLQADTSNTEQLSKELAGTKSNINFMNAINNMFSYVQLPLKLRNQNIHSDLYVLTNKKKLQQDKSNVNVLLHLDMEYLGTMDININLSGNVVNTKFHVSDDYTRELLSKNMEQLEYAMLEKGFILSSSVDLKEKEINLVNDFLSSDTPSTSIKRYTFDMRG